MSASSASLVVAVIGADPFEFDQIETFLADSASAPRRVVGLPVDGLTAAVYAGRTGVSARRLARLPLARAARRPRPGRRRRGAGARRRDRGGPGDDVGSARAAHRLRAGRARAHRSRRRPARRGDRARRARAQQRHPRCECDRTGAARRRRPSSADARRGVAERRDRARQPGPHARRRSRRWRRRSTAICVVVCSPS